MPRRMLSEERKFIEEYYCSGHSCIETCEEFNKRFPESVTAKQIKNYVDNHKLVNGRSGRFEKGHVPHNKGKHFPAVGRAIETQFKKGQAPLNARPMGYEMVSSRGFIRVKVREHPVKGKGCFERKHRLVWEQAHGEIPEGYVITFLDGNPQNCALENLALISKAEHLNLQRLGLRTSNPQLTETGILVARMVTKIFDMKKEKNNGRN